MAPLFNTTGATIKGFTNSHSTPNVQYGKDDPNRLFIGFIQPAGGHPGHVWLIYKGKTLESHGGAGVSSRDWDTPILLSKASAAYELPCEGA